jgi:hypothetical protein
MGAESEDGAAKGKHQENPFIEPAQHQTVVDMKGKKHILEKHNLIVSFPCPFYLKIIASRTFTMTCDIFL